MASIVVPAGGTWPPQRALLKAGVRALCNPSAVEPPDGRSVNAAQDA